MEILYQGPKSFYFRNAAVDVLIIEHFNAMGGESCVEVVLSDTIQHGKEYPRIYMNPRLILDRLNKIELSDRIDQMKRPFGNDLTKQGHKQIVRAVQVQMMSSFIISHLHIEDKGFSDKRKIVSVVLRDSETGSEAVTSTGSIVPAGHDDSDGKFRVPVAVVKPDKLEPFDISNIKKTPQWRDHHLILDSKLQNSCLSFPSPTAASIASRNEHRLAHKEGGEGKHGELKSHEDKEEEDATVVGTAVGEDGKGVRINLPPAQSSPRVSPTGRQSPGRGSHNSNGHDQPHLQHHRYHHNDLHDQHSSSSSSSSSHSSPPRLLEPLVNSDGGHAHPHSNSSAGMKESLWRHTTSDNNTTKNNKIMTSIYNTSTTGTYANEYGFVEEEDPHLLQLKFADSSLSGKQPDNVAFYNEKYNITVLEPSAHSSTGVSSNGMSKYDASHLPRKQQHVHTYESQHSHYHPAMQHVLKAREMTATHNHHHHQQQEQHNHHHHQQQHADHLPPLTTSDSKRDVLHNHHHHHHHHHHSTSNTGSGSGSHLLPVDDPVAPVTKLSDSKAAANLVVPTSNTTSTTTGTNLSVGDTVGVQSHASEPKHTLHAPVHLTPVQPPPTVSHHGHHHHHHHHHELSLQHQQQEHLLPMQDSNVYRESRIAEASLRQTPLEFAKSVENNASSDSGSGDDVSTTSVDGTSAPHPRAHHHQHHQQQQQQQVPILEKKKSLRENPPTTALKHVHMPFSTSLRQLVSRMEQDLEKEEQYYGYMGGDQKNIKKDGEQEKEEDEKQNMLREPQDEADPKSSAEGRGGQRGGQQQQADSKNEDKTEGRDEKHAASNTGNGNNSDASSSSSTALVVVPAAVSRPPTSLKIRARKDENENIHESMLI